MKYQLLLTLFLTFLIASCGDDAASPESNNPLTGKWTENQINGEDTLRIVMIFNAGSKISGTSDILLFRRIIEDNITKEERLEYTASVIGNISENDVKIKVLVDDDYFFKGKLSPDKKSISGIISLYSPMLDKIVDNNINLIKQ